MVAGVGKENYLNNISLMTGKKMVEKCEKNLFLWYCSACISIRPRAVIAHSPSGKM